jgi:hypothetical protein
MWRIILAPIPVSSTSPPSRAQAPNSINTIARGMRASGCIRSTREKPANARMSYKSERSLRLRRSHNGVGSGNRVLISPYCNKLQTTESFQFGFDLGELSPQLFC